MVVTDKKKLKASHKFIC